ncbi:hypothetical protein LINGRAHAP2_LOCUS30574 [Linum grandiflorum]
MERVLKPYDKEYMRLAMLKHEETFKQQVFELHRLYRIQKLLMRSIGKTNNYHHQGLWNSSRTQNNNNNIIPPADKFVMKLDLERPAEEFAESNGEEEERNGSVLDESEIELTLGPASYSSSKKKPPETALSSESAEASLSSSSTGSSHINRRNNKAIEDGFRGPVDSETGINRQKDGSSTSNVDILKQQQQPPWLFQVLSLNMT